MSDDVEEQLARIGDQLRIARVKAYLTQGDVGQRAGVSRQLVSRIEQGFNGEIRAYLAVAAALNHRFIVEEQAAANEKAIAALDFTSEAAQDDEAGARASDAGEKKPKRSRPNKRRGAEG
jgi:transcriptional regulator with XRE-family HTH domain